MLIGQHRSTKHSNRCLPRCGERFIFLLFAAFLSFILTLWHVHNNNTNTQASDHGETPLPTNQLQVNVNKGETLQRTQNIPSPEPESTIPGDEQQTLEVEDMLSYDGDSDNQRYFYIYPWPHEIVNRWPDSYDTPNQITKTGKKQKQLAFQPHFRDNHAVGRVVNISQGLYYTHQYSLFETFYTRLMESPLRTDDITKASLFFIPYDIGMDCSVNKTDGALQRTDCPMLDAVINLLRPSPQTLAPGNLPPVPTSSSIKPNPNSYPNPNSNPSSNRNSKTVMSSSESSIKYSPFSSSSSSSSSSNGHPPYNFDPEISRYYFHRHQGKDHFMLVSINQMMNFYIHKKKFGLYDLCFNCTKLCIDAYAKHMYPNVYAKYPSLYKGWKSIPFPSDYHYSNSVTHAPWEDEDNINGKALHTQRTYALSFMGTTKVTAQIQITLRTAIMEECKSRSHQCILAVLDTHESIADTITHRNPYLRSRLCLMPGGDFPTRKGFLDAMLSGCVPVIFQEFTALRQWEWHWGSLQKAKECMLFMPREEMISNATLAFDKLLSWSHDVSMLRDKLACIRDVGRRMQYDLPGYRDRDRDRDKRKTYPLDAVDISIESLLHRSIS